MTTLKERYQASMVLSGVGDAIGYKNQEWEYCTSGRAWIRQYHGCLYAPVAQGATASTAKVLTYLYHFVLDEEWSTRDDLVDDLCNGWCCFTEIHI